MGLSAKNKKRHRFRNQRYMIEWVTWPRIVVHIRNSISSYLPWVGLTDVTRMYESIIIIIIIIIIYNELL